MHSKDTNERAHGCRATLLLAVVVDIGRSLDSARFRFNRSLKLTFGMVQVRAGRDGHQSGYLTSSASILVRILSAFFPCPHSTRTSKSPLDLLRLSSCRLHRCTYLLIVLPYHSSSTIFIHGTAL